MHRSLIVLVAMLLLAGCAETITSSLEAGSEVAVIASLRTVHTVQTQFLMKNNRYGTLEELRSAGLIDESLAAGKAHRYIISLVSADEKGYALRADPAPENKLDLRHFYIDQTGVVRASMNRPAGQGDPPAVM